MKLWSEYSLIDEDGNTITYGERYVRCMREYRDAGVITGAFFAKGQAGDDEGDEAWEWGPSPYEIDWTGLDTLMAAADIASRAGVTVDAVHQWSKRHPEFRALAQPTSAGLIWRWHEVEEWLRGTGRL